MRFFSRKKSSSEDGDSQPASDVAPTKPEGDLEKNPAVLDQSNPVNGNEAVIESDNESTHKQGGVKRVEAITTVWTKKTLVVMFVLLYLVSFVDMLLVAVQSSLNPYVTSAFSQHGLLATTGIVASILGGSSRLTIAKVIDIWGRIEGFICMVFLVALGMVMKAVCRNVETYAAAHTIYWVGHLGLIYVIDIMLADMTSLKNRMVIIGLNNTPTIASTFAGPAISELFLTESNFRWAFGAFAIILVGFCLPVAAIMLLTQRKAYNQGVIVKQVSERTKWESFKYYFIQFDVIGIILVTAAFSLILLPFSLASATSEAWSKPTPIVMIVVGTVSMVLFVLWERYWAPVQFFPFKYLKERTIIGSSLLYGIMFISIFTWDAYYLSYLQVVHRLSVTHAGYVLNTFSLTSSFFGPIIGAIIAFTGEFKWTAYSGIPFVVLGTALLVPFRTPETHVGLLVMCQMLNGIGTGLFAACGKLAIMAAVTHQEIAVVVALWGMFGSIGAAVGFAIAGGLWNNLFPTSLLENLPEAAKDRRDEIYGDMVVQMSFPDGDPLRDAVVDSYAYVQRVMVIAGACFIPIMLGCIVMWRNINVKKLEEEKGKQTKGTVW